MNAYLLILFSFFILLITEPLSAQIKVGDTLVMPDSRELKDTTLEFRFKSEDTESHRMTVGLVLSGGGAKGLAHVGVLKVLEREGIHIDYIGGTSMGGLVGGLYAAGYSPTQLDEICNELKWGKLLTDEKERGDLPIQERLNYDSYMLGLPMVGYIPGLPKGLKEGQLIVNVLNKLTWAVNDVHNFENLPTPFFCVATDLETGDTVLLKNGDLPMALRATMSIPSVFAPVEYNGRTVVDGMIVNNYPVDIMLSQGLDYIIGVDVGSDLYKSDEIESVLDILDQISSFHQIKRYKDNIFLTDMYIKPDLTNIGVMSFDDVNDVIKRGEDAAMAHITEIRLLAKELGGKRETPRLVKLNMSDTIFISRMEVSGLERVAFNMVEGRLDINLPGVNSISNINAAIDRLYSSNFFKSINYKLIREEGGYLLKINVEENSNSFFNVGGRYDTDLGASLILNVELINKIIPGSRLDFTLKVGPNPAGGIRYLIDRGKNIGFVFDAHYNSNSIKVYSEDYKTVEGSYYMSFSSIDLLLLSSYSNSASFILGGTMEYMNVSTEVSPIPINYSGTPFFNLFARYIIDSFDDRYFPSSGSYVFIEPKLITQYNMKSAFYVNVELASVINITKKFSFLPSAFLGGSWGGIENTGYFYMLGGDGYSRFKNRRRFVGLPMTASFSRNLAYGRFDIRYQIFPKHYITLKTNISAESNLFEELLFNSIFTYGGGLAYSLNSLVGPIDISVNVSNRDYNPSLFINIGYAF